MMISPSLNGLSVLPADPVAAIAPNKLVGIRTLPSGVASKEDTASLPSNFNDLLEALEIEGAPIAAQPDDNVLDPDSGAQALETLPEADVEAIAILRPSLQIAINDSHTGKTLPLTGNSPASDAAPAGADRLVDPRTTAPRPLTPLAPKSTTLTSPASDTSETGSDVPPASMGNARMPEGIEQALSAKPIATDNQTIAKPAIAGSQAQPIAPPQTDSTNASAPVDPATLPPQIQLADHKQPIPPSIAAGPFVSRSDEANPGSIPTTLSTLASPAREQRNTRRDASALDRSEWSRQSADEARGAANKPAILPTRSQTETTWQSLPPVDPQPPSATSPTINATFATPAAPAATSQSIMQAPAPTVDVASAFKGATDIGGAIEQVSHLRDTARAVRPELTLRTSEFGTVTMRLETHGSDLRATLAARDPAFVPAIQAAIADRAASAMQDPASQSSPRSGEQNSSNSHSGLAGQGFGGGTNGSGSDRFYGTSPGSAHTLPQPSSAQDTNDETELAARSSNGTAALAPGGARADGLFA